MLAASLALAGCGNGDLVGGATGGGSDPGTPTGNRAPSISGTPASTVTVGQPYDFTPSAFDPDGDVLRFEIAGKPTWASFNGNTGRLYGTPPAGTSGSFGGIEIRVTDGLAQASLPTFSVAVLASPTPPASTGPAVLNWSKPTQNTDGTALTNLAGFRIYYGQNSSSLTSVREIPDPLANTVTIDGLAVGTWYFAISSFTSAGLESARAGPVSVTIG